MPKTAWKTLMYALETQRGRVFVMWTLVVIGNGIAFSVPYFFKLIVDYVTTTPITDFQIYDLRFPILGVVFFLIMQEANFRIAHIMEVGIVVRAFRRVTTMLYHNLIERPSSYFEERLSGELGRRVEQIGTSVIFFTEQFPWEMAWAILGFGVATVLLFIANPLFLLVFGIWALFFFPTSVLLLRWQYKWSQNVATVHARLSGNTVDSLSNILLVHSFAAEEKEKENYTNIMDKVAGAERKERLVFVLNKFQQGVGNILLWSSLVITSVWLFSTQSITVGDFVLMAAVLPSITSIVWRVGDNVTRAVRSYGNLKNAVGDLQTEVEKVEEGTSTLSTDKASIDFQDVSFTYPGIKEPVFSDFSLHLKEGERVGIVGPSGAGKSTLIKLILRQYDANKGTVQIGGTNIREVTLQSLRDAIAFVPQDTSLFHRTLFENIQYAKPDATEEEIVVASKKAHAHDFIETNPNKYQTVVGERGVKLSGGQRQRIAIARAMLKNSPILVLDEATSSLDSESEEIVQTGLQELFKGRTVLAIAHRLSTLRSMDRIVVMQEGKIVEDGSPQELLATDRGVFKDMWEHQKSGFI